MASGDNTAQCTWDCHVVGFCLQYSVLKRIWIFINLIIPFSVSKMGRHIVSCAPQKFNIFFPVTETSDVHCGR